MRPALVPPILAALVASALVLPGPASADDAASEGWRCAANHADEPYPAPPPGTSTTALGDLPAPYELRAPAGRPRGVVVVVHGGGWVDVGRARLPYTEQEVSWWLDQGWAVANVDYRACGDSLPDVLRAFDAVRQAVGPDTPIVVAGESAGAHLALMVDARREDVDVVVAKAGPTNAATLREGRAYDADRRDMSSTLPALLADVWRGVFGPSWITEFSPVQQAERIQARVLVARPTHDPIVPEDQGLQLADALRAAHPDGWVRTLELESEPGEVWFSHALVSSAAEARFRAAEREAVAPWASGPSAAPERVAGWWNATTSGTGPTGPGTTDPGTTDPGTTDPGTTGPGTTGPGSPNPGTTSPGTAAPGTTGPGTTGPGAAGSATSGSGTGAAGSPPPTSAGVSAGQGEARTPGTTAGSADAAARQPAATGRLPSLAPASPFPSVPSTTPIVRLTAAQVRAAARSGVLSRFRYRSTPRRFVATCRTRSAATRRCAVSWTAARWRYAGTVDVPVLRGPGWRTTLRVVRTDPTGRRRVFTAR